MGSEQIGARVCELGDRQRTHRFHFHHAEEEWLIMVAGTPTVAARRPLPHERDAR
ncbi:MAG: hypothetical protein QOD65_2475, partial [Gaiellales bacterium]|nr:hypothetical protein [Gaiellales bacterium]